MPRLNERIAALEASGRTEAVRVIRMLLEETEEAARMRCGIPADANVLFIRRVIINPVEVRHAEH